MANLGYIGLGAMGGRIADRLLSKGHTVIGHNRTKSKAQRTDALEMGKQLGVTLPTGATARFLTAARGLGPEKEDWAAVFNVLAALSGVKA